MADNKGIFGKIMGRVTPGDDKKDDKPDERTGDSGGRGGLLGKAMDAIKGRDDDDGEKATPAAPSAPAAAPSAMPAESAGTGSVGAAVGGTGASAGYGGVATGEQAAANTSSTAPDPEWGKITGAGVNRMYTTREGDTLEAIAAYFYGDPAQKQRLIDDNWDLAGRTGPLKGGIRLHVGEDEARGDAVSGPTG